MTFEGVALNDELRTSSFTLLDHRISTTAIDELMGAYADFTDNLPEPSLETMAAMISDPSQLDALDYSQDTQAEWHKYRTNYPFPFKPGGYTNRSLQTRALREVHGIDLQDDPKEYFHYVPSAYARMAEQRNTYGWGPLPPEALHLTTMFGRIHHLGAETIKQAMSHLEETHPELASKVVTKQDLAMSPLRLLFYHPGQGETLAGGHYDKSILTAQLAESHEGLRIKSPATGEMQNIRRSREKAAIFAGSLLNLPHVYPDSELQPAWHDVTNIDVLNDGRSVQGQNVARWALIFFANSAVAGEIGKDITHIE